MLEYIIINCWFFLKITRVMFDCLVWEGNFSFEKRALMLMKERGMSSSINMKLDDGRFYKRNGRLISDWFLCAQGSQAASRFKCHIILEKTLNSIPIFSTFEAANDLFKLSFCWPFWKVAHIIVRRSNLDQPFRWNMLKYI